MTGAILATTAPAAPSTPVGYLVGVALAGLCTAFALVAPRLPGPLGAVSYRIGLAFNELPRSARATSARRAAGRGSAARCW